ncbi:MAG: ATP-binding protein [Pirellulales bacterium]|nr:ATP-binding protein [Pirellulales bacterium]
MAADSTHTWTTDLVIPSQRGAGKQFLTDLLDHLHAYHWPEPDIFGIHLSVEEAVVNAIKHGNRLDPDKTVEIHCQLNAHRLWIKIIDQGCGFDPAAVPDCTADENLEVPSGRGILLMKSFMNRVEYSPTGNSVIMEKTRAMANHVSS